MILLLSKWMLQVVLIATFTGTTSTGRHAATTLQAALKRHVVTRCDNPRHTARTNTPGEGPVLCYKSCHDNPKRVFCRATRAEYFNRILAQHGRKKRGRVWA